MRGFFGRVRSLCLCDYVDQIILFISQLCVYSETEEADEEMDEIYDDIETDPSFMRPPPMRPTTMM